MISSNTFRLRILIGVLLSCLALEFAKPAVQILISQDQKADFNFNYGFAVGRGHFAQDFSYHEAYVRRSGLTSDLYNVLHKDVIGGYRYYHPPASILSLYWVRWIPEPIARGVWCLAILFGIFILSFMWLRSSAHRLMQTPDLRRLSGSLVITSVLLTLSYPSIFSFERGNTDVIILAVLSLAAWTLATSAWTALGFLIGTAVLIKCYPAAIAVPIGAAAVIALMKGVLFRSMKSVGVGFRILCGAAASILVIVAPLWSLHRQYLTQVLPVYGPRYVNTPDCPYCHSLPVAFGIWGVGLFTALWLIGSFAIGRALLRDAEAGYETPRPEALRAFAYLTALSVFFAQISYDYNLILAIPMISAEVFAGRRRRLGWNTAGLAVFLIGVFLPRWVHQTLMPGLTWSPYLALQCLGLLVIGADLVIPAQKNQEGR